MRTVVIGGGAAGIAAARHLHDAADDVLLIEAKDRLGGRAHTVMLPEGPFDLGCAWLHSAPRNPWTAIARNRGFTIATDAAEWDRQWRDLGFTPEEQAAFDAASGTWEDAARAARDGPDRPLSDFITPGDPWRPLGDAISSVVNGAPLARISLHDWIAYNDVATSENWALREGYGALITGHAAQTNVRLGVRATRIDHNGPELLIATNAGTIATDRVIVAVPTPILANGALTFDPPLPDKEAAADALPLGLADKAVLRVDRVEWPPDTHLIGNPHREHTGSYRLSPFGAPLIEAFFGGDCAEAMAAGEAAAFAIDELVALLGNDWRARLSPVLTTRWRDEPFILGSYSYARVGHARARAILAESVDDRIYFAGEACSITDFSTAHGAYATGIAAARAILRER